jgi:hypothetical protein
MANGMSVKRPANTSTGIRWAAATAASASAATTVAPTRKHGSVQLDARGISANE